MFLCCSETLYCLVMVSFMQFFFLSGFLQTFYFCMCRTRGWRGQHRVPLEAHRGRLHPAAPQLCQQRPHRQGDEKQTRVIFNVCEKKCQDDSIWTAQKQLSHIIRFYIWAMAGCWLVKNFVSLPWLPQAAMDFCMNMNTKSNRRKLVRALFTVPRQR